MGRASKSKVYHKRAVVVYSGGLDSTVMLCHYLNQGYKVLALSFDYSQRHSRELEQGKKIIHRLAAAGHPVDRQVLRVTLGSKGALSGQDKVPHGHYADESMKATVVPYRNTVFIANALSIAAASGYQLVGIGCHAGDHPIYPDCRSEFVSAMHEVAMLGNWDRVHLQAPFQELSKSQIVAQGARFATVKVPFALTYSCYEGGQMHCGQCGTCVERIEAFKLAGVEDPTHYKTNTVKDSDEED